MESIQEYDISEFINKDAVNSLISNAEVLSLYNLSCPFVLPILLMKLSHGARSILAFTNLKNRKNKLLPEEIRY